MGFSKSIPNSIIIGENTRGIGTFGEVLSYVLPHSKMRIYLPSKILLTPDSQEGIGYLPDYWLDVKNPQEEIIKWLQNPFKYQIKLANSKGY